MNKMKLAFFLFSPVLIAIVAAQKQEQKRLILVPLGSNLSTGKHFSLQKTACLKRHDT